MNLINFLYSLAAYNCGAYGAGGYDQDACTTSGGALAYTGEPWFLALAIGLLILIVSVVVFLKKSSRRSK